VPEHIVRKLTKAHETDTKPHETDTKPHEKEDFSAEYYKLKCSKMAEIVVSGHFRGVNSESEVRF
jgi:hypothetical protein